ncbi:MAG: hypothetical protein IT381_01210 [Deltaproteobacteria bacterium]|nr:hypothetical protein [Deltaproteobacteria bacterium]
MFRRSLALFYAALIACSAARSTPAIEDATPGVDVPVEDAPEVPAEEDTSPHDAPVPVALPKPVKYPADEVVPAYPAGCGEACPYEIVSVSDPVLARAQATPAAPACAATDPDRVLVDEDFSTVPAAAENVGGIGWESDGLTLRPTTPSVYPGHSVGLLFWADVCPASGAVMTVDAKVIASDLRDASSKVELLLYAFDHLSNPIGLARSQPMLGGNKRPLVLFETPIPTGTRRLAIAVVATFGAGESGTVILDRMKATMQTAAKSATLLYSDDFAGDGALTPYAQDYGAWVVPPADDFLVLWNDAWNGTAVQSTYGILSRTLALPSAPADPIRASAFIATTFSDRSSYASFRLRFDTGHIVFSPRIGKGFDTLRIDATAIPAGATQAILEVVAYFGARETASFYLDDLRVELTGP